MTSTQTDTPTPPGPRSPELQRFGSRLRRLREDAGISQVELAKRSGVDRPSLNRLEAGRLDIRLSRVVALARALDCTPGDLFEPPSGGPET